MKQAEQTFLILGPVVAEKQNVRKPSQRRGGLVLEQVSDGGAGTFEGVRVFFYRNVRFSCVVHRIRPSQTVQRVGQSLAAMTTAHDVNVWHRHHHLNGDRNPTAAEGIKRCHLIALRPLV